MTQFLIDKFVDKNTSNVAAAVGRVLGCLGIVLNLFLFVIKFGIGTLVSSVSIQADAFNNLTDSLNNIISIFSFIISSQPADKEHPYGHERMETISSLIVGMLILVFGFELVKESFGKIIHPSQIVFSWATIVVLLISIVVKLWMYLYNKHYSVIYKSSMLEATTLDSISDVWSTSAILVSVVLSHLIHFNLDGYIGLLVSLIILWNAIKLIREVVSSLLGQAPEHELSDQIEEMILSGNEFLGVHDLMVHSYGRKKFASCHVEVDSSKDVFVLHESIDQKEREVKDKLDVELVLHMDPVKINDPETEFYKEQVEKAIKEINPVFQFHDFRVVTGQKNVNLVFDLVIPFDEKLSKEDIEKELLSRIKSEKTIHLVIDIDHLI